MSSAKKPVRPALPPHRARPEQAALALDGLLVEDFSHFVAGPFCTLILGDFGADVIKVENAARGDDFRSARPPELGGEGGAFLWTNRNKRSIALDLTMPSGREVARDLIRRADVVVENFSPGVMERFGLDYDTVSPDNPGLIYCSITAFGREGALAERTGFDPIVQAESGLMSLNGHPGEPPVVMATPVVDLTSGMMASNAILAALAARSRLGKGQHVELALFDQAIALLGYHGMSYLITGENPGRVGNVSPATVPVGAFETADDAIFLCCANERTYRRLALDILERPDLADGEDYATNPARAANREKLFAILAEIFRRDSADNWLAKMRRAGVPAGRVSTVATALSGPEVRERGLLSEIAHPSAGMIPNVALPFRMSMTPVADPRAAPLLGQHTEEILGDILGYDRERVEMLGGAGTFGKRPG